MRNRIAFLAALTGLLMLTGCAASRIGDISLQDYKVEEISPAGLRGVDVVLALTVCNPSVKITVSDISGTIYRKGTEFAVFSADPVTLNRKSTETYRVKGNLSLSSGVSLFDVISLAGGFDPEEFTLDVHAHGTLKNGIGKDVDKVQVPLSRLMEGLK